MSNDEKNICEHLMDGKLSHIDICLRTGGLSMLDTYKILLKLGGLGIVEKTEDLKFRLKEI